jgi:hypothetical protein
MRDERPVRDAPQVAAAVAALGAGLEASSVVLVEGVSDQRAVEALAARQGRDLGGEGVVVVAIGGAGNLRRYLQELGPGGRGLRLAGLCDAGEAAEVARVLEQAGLGAGLDRAGLGALGFFVCDADLEDELIRALGPVAVEQVLDAEGELRSYRTFQKQVSQQGRTEQARLRRFMGTRGGRKVRYGRLLVDALDLEHVPPPLAQLLAHV